MRLWFVILLMAFVWMPTAMADDNSAEMTETHPNQHLDLDSGKGHYEVCERMRSSGGTEETEGSYNAYSDCVRSMQ